MAAGLEPEVILYDLACTKNTCFSPALWRIRLMLNYKCIPYETICLEFPDNESTLKELGLRAPESSSGAKIKYTVPHPSPTSSKSTYSDPPLQLTSDLGQEIESKACTAIGPILSPRPQEYFRRTREAALGAWTDVEHKMRAVGELMLTNKGEGTFVLGANLSATDFFVAGSLHAARVVDEGVFERIMGFPEYGEVYEACVGWMEKRD
ncbi:hypothetical protein EK21DRAFT_104750 [Setomelanomma holmii]|uniref:Glutathione S-transferase UstS-like C-terminal domain-containing protein n=1 Tax=Setomelanomma holmii TaxID=210430 RepID=A0A9P4GYK2_9PLEO|nr:hypothetical protein EK21DRAFT_104750 [Setomelanomma holmii]